MMKRVLVPFSEGVEEIECIAVVDILRRAGVEVVLASLDGKPVTGRSVITIQPDAALADVEGQEWDMVVLPGGLPNADHLRQDEHVKAVVQRLSSQRRHVAAICAAPTALAAFGVLGGLRVTSYPAVQETIEKLAPDAVYCDDVVVQDGFLVTSRGAGTAVEFALRLVQRLCGEEKATEVRKSIVG